jgi:hypothetical protein
VTTSSPHGKPPTFQPVPTPNHNTTTLICPHCRWAPPDPTSHLTQSGNHIYRPTRMNLLFQSQKSQPLSLMSLAPTPLACNNPTNDYVLQSNLDSHNKHINATTRSHMNSKFLANIFPDSNWSSTLTWLQTLDIHPPPFWHNIYPHLLGNDSAMTHETTKKTMPSPHSCLYPPQIANSPMDKTSPDPLWKPVILNFLPPLGTQLLYILTMPILPTPMLPRW